jgi:hypothetical protein
VTVHPRAGYEEFSTASALVPFLSVVSAAPWRVDPAFYPPILVGDTNALAGDRIPNFIDVHVSDGDVMTVRRGSLGFYPALNDYRTVERRVIPHSQAAAFFSDHIGLFVRLGWVDPNHYASATRIADVPNGAVVGKEEGGLWHCCWLIAGGAKFDIPDSDTHDRLYNGRSQLLAPGSLDAIGRVPLDGTVLREEAGPLWVTAGGAKLSLPDEATLARLYPGARAVALWNHALDSIPNVPQNGTLIRDDDGKVWLIAGGAKFLVPSLDVISRLYSERRPFPLWNGALANIGQLPIVGTLLREESSQSVFVMRRGGLVPATGFHLVEDVVILWDGALQSIPQQ